MEKIHEAQRPIAIYAHPDDEVIGCSYAIHQLRNKINIVYATNGMPSPISDPIYYFPHTQYIYGDSYRLMRHKESKHALSILGMKDDSRIHFLDFPDSSLHQYIETSKAKIKQVFQKIEPDLIFTAAYEGGHIDHDILTSLIWLCTEGYNLTICETPLYSSNSLGKINHNMPIKRHNDWEKLIIKSDIYSYLKKLAFKAYASQNCDLQFFNPDADELYYFTHRQDINRCDLSDLPNEGNILYAKILHELHCANLHELSSISSRLNE